MVTDKQVKRLFKLRRMGMTQQKMADKTNMDVKTARKYLKEGKLPGQLAQEHTWRTRTDPFDSVWEELEELLEINPGLQAKTLFKHIQKTCPDRFPDGQLRTLQRKIKGWRATEGPAKEIFFEQEHKPGTLCASDYTDMNNLCITIAGYIFDHKLYHFILTYSNWETGTVCFSESFESLSEGFQNALWELGGVPGEHLTDRLSAAVNNLSDVKKFTERYEALLHHYRIQGRKTQAARPNENGDIEQSNYRYKTAIDQALMLRGSRDFNSREEYEDFLKKIFAELNSNRLEKLAEEMKCIRPLPDRRCDDFTECTVRVSKFSTIRVKKQTYSVPARLRGERVRVRIHAETLDVYYGQKKTAILPRIRGKKGHRIDYRHIIDALVRKPGAFRNYRYRDELFPTAYFRMAYDRLLTASPGRADKEYLLILWHAAHDSEDRVNAVIKRCINASIEINAKTVDVFLSKNRGDDARVSVNVPEADLRPFDELYSFEGLWS